MLDMIVRMLQDGWKRIETEVELNGKIYKLVAYRVEQASKAIIRIDLTEVIECQRT